MSSTAVQCAGSRREACSRRALRIAWVCLLAARAVSAAPSGRPNLEGVWITTQLSPTDARWKIEDFLCNGAFCTAQATDYMHSFLAEPATDALPLKDVSERLRVYGRTYVTGLLTETGIQASKGFEQKDDPVNRCVPTGFNFAAGPLPIEFKQFGDHVELRYEFWNSTRTIYTDGRDHPAKGSPTRLGHSIGWYESATLVVETVGIEPHLTYWIDGARSSARARVYERYSRSADGQRLEMERVFVDPVMLRRPLVTRESRLLAPGVQLMDYRCETLYKEGYQPKRTP